MSIQTNGFKQSVLTQLIRCSMVVVVLGGAASFSYAEGDTEQKAAVLPTVKVEAMSEQDPTKSYVGYKQANITRNGQDVKDTPQTIDTIDVQKYKIYGANDLSVMLAGTPGVNTQYDMRGDGITIRGFSASDNDIYRDGVRESGQIRRSTANIERIEILKGPASVLYGRSAGGGVVNMVSKFANFDSPSNIGVYAGTWDNLGLTLDSNNVINENVAVRVTSEVGQTDSFREGINNKIRMVSPSITVNNREGLQWTAQYTYDELQRVPDRGPDYSALPKGTSIETSFAQKNDFVDDILNVYRSDLTYEFNEKWNLHWSLSYREAEQNFDHFYGGTYCDAKGTTPAGAICAWARGYVRQSYAWQETINKTATNTVDIKGEFNTGSIQHNVIVGLDSAKENRNPSLFTNGTTSIYGYVNPFDQNDKYTDLDTKPHPAASAKNKHVAESHGLFVQDVVTLVQEVKVVLGARYDWYDFESTAELETNPLNRNRSYDGDSVSPSAGVVWQPVEEHSIYASFNKSFAPYGGRGLLSVATNAATVYDDEPQYNEQFEVGIKSDWLNKRLNTQFSVYNIEKNNIRYRPDPDNDPFTWAVQGEQESKGAEFSVIGRALDNLYVRGGYGWMDATVTKDVTTPGNVGKYLNGTGEDTANLFVRYAPVDQWYAEVGVTHVSDTWANAANTNKLEGYDRFDAALGYSANSINVTLAVSNLTDKEYWRAGSMPGSPRNVLVRANYQF
jgi:iron complex outermembrane receptor protein